MLIDKDTDLFCSFSPSPGNLGCARFNNAFQKNGINAIYKSFKITDIKSALEAVKTLNIKGCAIAGAFKTQAMDYLDEATLELTHIKACNTVLNKNGRLKGFNTDFLAVKEYLGEFSFYKKGMPVIVVGDGGFSRAVQYALCSLSIDYMLISRRKGNWGDLITFKKCGIINCTPVEHLPVHCTNLVIHADPSTITGKQISFLQAKRQFELYTGRNDLIFEEV